MDSSHPDFANLNLLLNDIVRLGGGLEALTNVFPIIIANAVDFVIDPISTGRTRVSELDNVEKTFIGLKIEHFLRDFLDVPKGLRDLRIGDIDVDVKNTVSRTWMIPPETFKNSEPCILIMVATDDRRCSIGLMIAKLEYLNKGNRDAKRSVSARAFANILWILKDQSLPESRFLGLNMARFRELRKMRGGSKRAANFFRENLERVVHRSVIRALLFDQDDYMKRIRWNGGAKDILVNENIAILSGAYAKAAIAGLGLPTCRSDEFIAYKFDDKTQPILASSGYFNRKSDR
jgi:Restriction endonuclease NaeI